MVSRFDREIYSLEALLKAAYHFLDRAYLHLSKDESNWIVAWTDKEGSSVTSEDFENELISQQLRFKIVTRTADIRKLMLARAFASTMMDVTSNAPKQTTELDEDEEKDIFKGWYDVDH